MLNQPRPTPARAATRLLLRHCGGCDPLMSMSSSRSDAASAAAVAGLIDRYEPMFYDEHAIQAAGGRFSIAASRFMGKVVAGASMSLDGFSTDHHSNIGPLYPDFAAYRASKLLQRAIRTTGA